MKLYRILSNGYFGGIVEVPNGTEGLEPGLTSTSLNQDIPEGQWAYWIGSGWALTSTDPNQLIEIPLIPESIVQIQMELPLDTFESALLI